MGKNFSKSSKNGCLKVASVHLTRSLAHATYKLGVDKPLFTIGAVYYFLCAIFIVDNDLGCAITGEARGGNGNDAMPITGFTSLHSHLYFPLSLTHALDFVADNQ